MVLRARLRFRLKKTINHPYIRDMRLLLLFLIISRIALAQVPDKRILNFHVRFGERDLMIGDTFYKLSKGDSIQIEELKFYVSGITLWNGNEKVWVEQNSFHLIDVTKPASMKLGLNVSAALVFNQLSFNLGIDSVTNVSGAMGGDLDPTKGMYWTWQSGYINMKLEGNSNLCTTRNHAFQYHLGGYQSPFNALQQVKLSVTRQNPVHLIFNVKELLTQLDLAKQAEIMSPGKEASWLSKKMVQYFTVEKK